MPQFGQITPTQAMRLVGTPDAPRIFDVRLPEDLDAPPRLIPTSRTVPLTAIDSLSAPPGRAIVVCMKGRRLSEGAAACLRTKGRQAEALDRIATVIRAADSHRHGLAPQAVGLLALSVGLSRIFRDDLQQLDAGLVLYDALYRWARDGHEEGHDWPAGRCE